MNAIVYDAPLKFSYRSIPDPEPGPEEVLLKVQACGVCGTDIHLHHGDFSPKFPLIPGHEFTGEIVAIGSEVEGLQVGQRVVGNSNMSCGKCFYCLRGDTLLCTAMESYGVTIPGGFADLLKIRADRIFPLRNLSSREAVMVEPTACAVHGTEVLDAKPGSSVLLFGAGPTGQVLAQLIKLNGATNLVVAAPPGPKLDLAEKLAADTVVAIDKNDPEKHRRRLNELAPNGFDYVVEATGSPQMCQETLRFVRRRGTIMVYGVYPPNAAVAFDPFDVFRRELTIKGSYAQIDSFPRSLSYLESGRVKVNEIVTHEIPLKNWGEALELIDQRQGIKMALIPS
jgi:D-arabinitol dehydrogenase (NADP+)